MLTMTTKQHLNRVRERIVSGELNQAEYNDVAVIALHYSMHARNEQDRIDAAFLYDMVVQTNITEAPKE